MEIKISIVIPVYKSVESLEEICKQVDEIFNDKLSSYTYELVFVNDSPFFKPTSEKLIQLAKEFQRVKVIQLRKNIGQQLALLLGVKKATGKLIITMDDDLQHPVEEFPKLVQAIAENDQFDAIFAIPPYSKKKHSPIRNFGSWLVSKIDDLTLDRPKGLVKSSFRIFKADLVPYIVNNFNAAPAMSGLIINATKSIVNIEVKHKRREFGQSNYTLKKLLMLTFNNFVYHSSLPLAVIGVVGVLSFIGSGVFVVITLIRKLMYDISVPGYTSIVTITSFFGGFTLLGIGIIGEYLVRIIKELNKPNLEDFIKNEQ